MNFAPALAVTLKKPRHKTHAPRRKPTIGTPSGCSRPARRPGERRDKTQFFRVALRGGETNTRKAEQPLTFGPPMAPRRSLLLTLLLTVAVRQTAGRSKGQPMVGGAADAPEKRSCADIVGAAAAECPRSVAQAMSVAELQRVCDLKMGIFALRQEGSTTAVAGRHVAGGGADVDARAVGAGEGEVAVFP